MMNRSILSAVVTAAAILAMPATAASVQFQPVGQPVVEPGSVLEGLLPVGPRAVRIQASIGGHQFLFGKHILATDIESHAYAFEYAPYSGHGRDYDIVRFVAQRTFRCPTEYRVLTQRGGILELSTEFGACGELVAASVDALGVLHVRLRSGNGSPAIERVFGARQLHWHMLNGDPTGAASAEE